MYVFVITKIDYIHFSAQSNDDLDLGYEIVTRRNLVWPSVIDVHKPWW